MAKLHNHIYVVTMDTCMLITQIHNKHEQNGDTSPDMKSSGLPVSSVCPVCKIILFEIVKKVFVDPNSTTN